MDDKPAASLDAGYFSRLEPDSAPDQQLIYAGATAVVLAADTVVITLDSRLAATREHSVDWTQFDAATNWDADLTSFEAQRWREVSRTRR